MKLDRQKLMDIVFNDLIPINSLSKYDQAIILKESRVLTYVPGQYIFEQGDRDEFSYYLLEGKLEMQSLEETNYIVTTDTEHYKYELAMVKPRHYSARALTTVRVLQINSDTLHNMNIPQQGRMFNLYGEDEFSEICPAS